MAIGDYVVTRAPEPEFLLPSSEPLEPADLKLSDLQLQSQTTRVPFSLSFNTLLDFMTLYAQIRSYPCPSKDDFFLILSPDSSPSEAAGPDTSAVG